MVGLPILTGECAHATLVEKSADAYQSYGVG